MGWFPCECCGGEPCCCGTESDEWIVDLGASFLVDAACDACDLIAGEFTLAFTTHDPLSCTFKFEDLAWCVDSLTGGTPDVALTITLVLTPNPFVPGECTVQVTIALTVGSGDAGKSEVGVYKDVISPDDDCVGDFELTLPIFTSSRDPGLTGALCSGSWPATITVRIA